MLRREDVVGYDVAVPSAPCCDDPVNFDIVVRLPPCCDDVVDWVVGVCARFIVLYSEAPTRSDSCLEEFRVGDDDGGVGRGIL